MESQLLREIELLYDFKCVEGPTKLKGGSIHDVYKIISDKGVYVAKVLSDNLYNDVDYMSRLDNANKLEKVLKQNGIPIVSALQAKGRMRQEINGKGVYIFEYYEGRVLDKNEISSVHCMKMGEVLANIHNIKIECDLPEEAVIDIKWDELLKKLFCIDVTLYDVISGNLNVIIDFQEKSNAAIEDKGRRVAICHNDLGKKNVLWKDEQFRIIDMEGMAFADPLVEIYGMALAWSWFEGSCLRKESFTEIINSYVNSGGKLLGDMENVYYRNNKRISWLAFNISRFIEEKNLCKREEYKRHILFAINNINNYRIMKDQIMKLLYELI